VGEAKEKTLTLIPHPSLTHPSPSSSPSVWYDIWIRYSASTILGWYCTCRAGARVVGCCAYCASIMWYLSFARHHPEHLKQESSSFLNSLTDAADYSDASDKSDIETDSDEDNLLYTLS